MAARKKLETGPIHDNSALLADPDLEKSKVVYVLSMGEFKSIMRQILTINLDEVKAFTEKTIKRLKELGVPEDLTEVYPITPAGSDQFDFGTLYAWIDGIEITDPESVKQLIAMDATAKSRLVE